jgi:FtsP/CotA-like multicopper oxidase with cupredoxin domain
MQTGQWEILPGVKTETIGFSGPYLGPTIRVRNGQDVPITYTNRWNEAVAVHGHGLHVPGIVDGGPHQLIEPGDSWSPVLPIRQQASTAWYHPHTHGKTGSQTYKGLAGMLLIEDDNSRDLPLPKTYGVNDLPLNVQDRTLDAQGQFVYRLNDADKDGFLGDFVTANGIAGAEAAVPAGLVRLRLLNGSNARFYRFHFADGRTFHKIATEGGFLSEPVPIQELVMLPGERNEIVVDCADGEPARLVSSPGSSRSESHWDDRERRDRPNGLGDSFEVVTLQPDPRLPVLAKELPRQLSVVNRPAMESNWPRRRFRLNMEAGRNEQRHLQGDRNGQRTSVGKAHGHGMSMSINRQPMNMRVINERVRLGQWEIWEVEADRRTHPFHVHGCSFLLLSQDGRQVADADVGWKDTVLVDEGTTTFAVRFDHPAADDCPYMYHCHILEHEDMGMMGQFTVT